VEPLEQVIDDLKEQLRTRHILRMQQGQCSIEAGFVWSDLLTDLERTSDHCSNIAGCVIDAAHHDLNMHATLDAARRRDPDFREQYQRCAAKYQV
jgi:phosphate:Na+ symporter